MNANIIKTQCFHNLRSYGQLLSSFLINGDFQYNFRFVVIFLTKPRQAKLKKHKLAIRFNYKLRAFSKLLPHSRLHSFSTFKQYFHITFGSVLIWNKILKVEYSFVEGEFPTLNILLQTKAVLKLILYTNNLQKYWIFNKKYAVLNLSRAGNSIFSI